ncbi:MAG: TolC family protein [Acidobacteria bacterium]|nr:TolC family protein [Acidobacteriota bacterium]MBV9478942.1 TolC family protein [Acidobacteriota bacterium]
MNRGWIAASLLFACACASVPRDAGVADVRRAVAERSGQSLTWARDDERVRALLQDELTADNAVAIGVINNRRLEATFAELGIARADLVQASLVRNPIFEAEVRFPRDPFRPFELRLAQTLVDLVQLPRRRALGRAAFDAAKLRVTSDVLMFAADIRARHADLLAAAQRVALSRTSFETAQASAELAQRQHDAQNITDLELENEQARYEDAKLDLAREEQQFVLARESLVRAMGVRDVPAELHLPDAFPPLPATEPDEAQLEQLASARRLDVQRAMAEVQLARMRVPLARLAALDDVTVDAHYQRDAAGAKTVGPGIELPIPLFNNGAAARTRAEHELVRANALLQALLDESSSRIRTARASVAEARARVEYYRDVVVPRRQRIVELTKLEHNAMLVGPFTLLDARRNETQARRDFIDAQRDYWRARITLDAAVNGVEGDTP